MQVISNYVYIFDDSLGPISTAFKGAECISYLAIAFDSDSTSFGATVKIDGFLTTLSDYTNWEDSNYGDGRAVQIPASSCANNVSYCTATVKNLNAAETYVLVFANGYNDSRRADTHYLRLAYAAGSQGMLCMLCTLPSSQRRHTMLDCVNLCAILVPWCSL